MSFQDLPYRRLGLALVLAVASMLLLRDLGNPSLGYPDADRLLMDGVFIHDFLRDLPLTRIYDYAIHYYAQYPALSIGYRPPFFPFIEALFNAAFGINPWSGRLAVLAFVIVGVTAWFRLVERLADTATAFWASLLLVTTPYLVQWGWYTMSELPVLFMALLTAYAFYRFTETERPHYIYATAILVALTAWTKQTGIFLPVLFVLYAVSRKRLPSYLTQVHVWLAALLAVILLAPLAVITLWLGDVNIAQSVGVGRFSSPAWRLRLGYWTPYLTVLVTHHLTPPVAGLSLLGLVWAILKRDSRGLYPGLLALSTFLFFSYLNAKDARYPIFWIPAFALFAALPFFYMRHLRWLRIAGTVALAAISLYQIDRAYARTPDYATGYDHAARYVLQHNSAPAVFFDGINNGYFTYFMRALDGNRSTLVLRGNKLLTSAAIGFRSKLAVHASSREDIRHIFDKYGVVYVVVESKDHSWLPIHRTLREFLASGPFALDAEIPVDSNRPGLKGQRLLVYRYLEPKPSTADSLELRLPIVGKTLTIPLSPPSRPLPFP